MSNHSLGMYDMICLPAELTPAVIVKKRAQTAITDYTAPACEQHYRCLCKALWSLLHNVPQDKSSDNKLCR